MQRAYIPTFTDLRLPFPLAAGEIDGARLGAMLDKVRAWLDILKPKLTRLQHATAEKYFWEGYTQEQIAELQGVTQVTVCRRLRRVVEIAQNLELHAIFFG